MGLYSADIQDRMALSAQVRLLIDIELLLRDQHQPIPEPHHVRLLIDTGSKRSTLTPSSLDRFNPTPGEEVRVETAMGILNTSKYWIRLDFPDTPLQAIPELAVVRCAMPPSLRDFHGLIGRDLLHRWEYFLYEGRRGRLTIRDTRRSIWEWLTGR